MIKKVITTSIAIAVMAMAVAEVKAAFVDSYWGVRALGMGGAFTAVANDSNAPLYNIAGTGNLNKREITVMGSRLFAGLEGVEISKMYLSYIQPLKAEYGTLSFSWSSLSTPGLRREDTFNVGYGRTINDLLKINRDKVNITAGLNLKYLMQEVNFDEEDSDLSNSKGALTADIGLLAQFANGISIGYSNRYLTSPDIGYLTEDKVTNTSVFGLAYHTDLIPGIKIPNFTIALDYVMRAGDNGIRAGAESVLFEDKLAIRLGGRQEAFDIGLGYKFDFTNGMSLMVDYALELPMEVEESYGSHFIGLTLRLP